MGQFAKYLLRVLNELTNMYHLNLEIYCINRKGFTYNEFEQLKGLPITELIGPISNNLLDKVRCAPDILIHGASPSSPKAERFDYLNANIFSSKILMDKAVEWNCQSSIFMSSSAIHGEDVINVISRKNKTTNMINKNHLMYK